MQSDERVQNQSPEKPDIYNSEQEAEKQLERMTCSGKKKYLSRVASLRTRGKLCQGARRKMLLGSQVRPRQNSLCWMQQVGALVTSSPRLQGSSERGQIDGVVRMVGVGVSSNGQLC